MTLIRKILLSSFLNKIYFLFLIIFFLIICNNAPISNCMPGDDEINEFMNRGFKDRIQVLMDTVNTCEDPAILREIFQDLSAKINQVAVPFTNDPFSGYESPNINVTNLPFGWKEMLYRLLLFFFATGFGYVFLNFPLLVYPIIYYKNHISIFLSIMQKDPSTFIDYISEFYTMLDDDGFFDVASSDSNSSASSSDTSFFLLLLPYPLKELLIKITLLRQKIYNSFI